MLKHLETVCYRQIGIYMTRLNRCRRSTEIQKSEQIIIASQNLIRDAVLLSTGHRYSPHFDNHQAPGIKTMAKARASWEIAYRLQPKLFSRMRSMRESQSNNPGDQIGGPRRRTPYRERIAYASDRIGMRKRRAEMRAGPVIATRAAFPTRI